LSADRKSADDLQHLLSRGIGCGGCSVATKQRGSQRNGGQCWHVGEGEYRGPDTLASASYLFVRGQASVLCSAAEDRQMTEEGDGKSKTALTPKGSTVSRTRWRPQGPRGRLVEDSLVLCSSACSAASPQVLPAADAAASASAVRSPHSPARFTSEFTHLTSPHLTVLVSPPSPAIDGQHVIYEAENNPDAPGVPSHARAQPCCLSPPTGRSNILTY